MISLYIKQKVSINLWFFLDKIQINIKDHISHVLGKNYTK